MRRYSTRIGVYAILLITSFYGILSVMEQQGKTATDAIVITQKAGTSTGKKVPTASQSFKLNERDNCKASYSVTLQPNTAISANTSDELNFFTHSAILQHYINTL